MKVHPILALPFLFSFVLLPVSAEEPRTAQEIVQHANKLLAQGSYLEAARSYSDAIGELAA